MRRDGGLNMWKYVAIIALLCLASGASADEWLTLGTDGGAYTFAADSTDTSKTIWDTTSTGITDIRGYSKLHIRMAMIVDSAFTNDTMRVRFIASMRDVKGAGPETCLATYKATALATTLTWIDTTIFFSDTSKNWWGYLRADVVYSFPVAATAGTLALSGRTFHYSWQSDAFLDKKWK
jgi:hypothetical protein